MTNRVDWTKAARVEMAELHGMTLMAIEMHKDREAYIFTVRLARVVRTLRISLGMAA